MSFDWSNPYASTRAPVFARNAVAASQPLAAQAGLRMLAAGGNAVDAAVACAATLAITEPVSNGLGSDCFAMVWDGSSLHGMDAGGPSPAAWSLDYFARKHGGRVPRLGWDSVTVPGAVAGWVALHERFGKLSLAAVLAPAIDYAENGFAVTPTVARKWAAQADGLLSAPGFAQAFLPDGRVPHAGARFVLADAAATLQRIAATQGRDFYEGETAHKIVAHAQAHEACMTLNDLRTFEPQWSTPLAQTYRGYRLHQTAGDGHGIAALMALGILEHFDIGARPVDHPDTQHVIIEAVKLALADVSAHLDAGDRASMRDRLLDPVYLAARAAAIDMQQAQTYSSAPAPRGGTVYLSTADRNGMMVSLTQSNYLGFGSGVVVPGTGVSLQNRGHSFSTRAGHPNAVAGGKVPLHTIIPGFLTLESAPILSFGVMGGNVQPQGMIQALVRLLDFKQQPQAVCDAPRWKWDHGVSLHAEAALNPTLRDGLRARGHVLERLSDPDVDVGSGQFIWRLGDPATQGYVAASDSRRDGLAAGF